jgi:hypothetical protein
LVNLLSATPSRAQNPPYLTEMPPVERVIDDTESADRLDTLARRASVLNQLQRVIDDMAGRRRYSDLTADERRIRDAYGVEIARIISEIEITLGGMPTVIDVNAPTTTEESGPNEVVLAAMAL